MPMVHQTSSKCGIPIDHRESKYRHFTMRRCRFVERMTEYMDKLSRLFRKARPRTPIRFQDKEIKNRPLAGIPTEIEIEVYLDLTASEITQKYDVIHIQRQALRRATMVVVEKTN